MIEELHISNLGVIENATVNFGPGMTALTGETGAGKTMTVTALQLLMGAKADGSRVRVGAEKAVVEGTFVVRADSPAVRVVSEAGGDVEEDRAGYVSIIVARHIPANGRSRAFVGGRAVPAGVLAQLAENIITLHGQADQQRLSSAAQQRSAVDAYGGAELTAVSERYTTAWNNLQAARAELEKFDTSTRAAATERMAMQMLVTRVDAVNPRSGEDADLKAEALRLSNVETLREAMGGAYTALSNDAGSGALDLVDRAQRELERTHDPELIVLAQQLIDANGVISDVLNAIGANLENLGADPERLEAIHARRAQLRNLERELGLSVDDMLSEADRARVQLAALEDPDTRRKELHEQLDTAHVLAQEAARELTDVRTRIAHMLAAAVNRELANLYMKDATFSVQLKPRAELAPWGGEDVMFALSAHSGAPAMELGRTASGGEMSRIMLALEVSLAARAAAADHTFIFDEVDAGIGGKSALAVGNRLAKLARHSQVMCVTHLAQVAAFASEQVVVAKDSSANGAITAVHSVQGEEREVELARMLSGHTESQAARTHAAELLRSAGMAV